jgi:hypothetical protein
MKIQSKLAVLFIISVLASNTLFSQTKDYRQPLPLVKYKSNVDAPLTVKELAQIKEVYGDQAEKEILNRPQRVKDIKHILRNRVVIQEHPGKDLSPYKPLSSVPLFNNYNKGLTRDSFFDANNFNVLKYSFDFYSRNENVMTYRIDNTNFLINIKPQHN